MTSEFQGVVIQGDEGYLYLGGGNHHVLDYLTDLKDVPELVFDRFERNLQTRAAYADRVGAKYLHCVAPDKHSVVREHFPYEIKSTIGEKFFRRSAQSFLYPVEALRSCPDSFGYLKTDTHMNFHGRVVMAEAVLNAFEIDSTIVAGKRNDLAGLEKIFGDFAGDLGSKLTPRQSEVASLGVQFDRHAGVMFYSNQVKNNGLITTHFNIQSGNKDRLLVFGDSFVLHCMPMLSLFFKEVLFLRTLYFHPEIADAFRPTHILTSNAERYLPHISNDQDAPLGIMMAALEGKTWASDVSHSRALNAALQSGGPHGRNFWRDIALEYPGIVAPPKIVMI